jgi:exonuclease SbcC
MKPHFLKFAGLGAFPQLTEINFDDLDSLGLYLIVGPTGSGKTTIFDAMTYALYGVTAGRSKGMLVSNYDDAANPMVELTFSHGSRRFIVHREPAKHDRNIVSNKQWFREIDSSGNEIRTVTNANAVTNEVIDLIGLTAEQFMQVILLPQGKFHKFLMAKSSDRQPLLQAIFGTTLYDRVGRLLERRADALNDEARTAKLALDRERTTIENVVQALRDAGYDLDEIETDEQIADVVNELLERHEELRSHLESTAARLDTATTELAKAAAEAGRFDAAQELEGLRVTHEAESSRTAAAKSSIEAHERAGRVAKAADSLEDVESKLEGAKSDCVKFRGALADSVRAIAVESPRLSTLRDAIPSASPTTLNAELHSLQVEIERVIRAHDTVQEASATGAKLSAKVAKFRAKFDSEKKRRLDLNKKLTTARKKQKEAESAASKQEMLQYKIMDNDHLMELGDVTAAQKSLATAERGLQSAIKTLKTKDDRLVSARAKMIKGLAGQLASELTSGTPCLVCGSKQHPKPAPKSNLIDLAPLEMEKDEAIAKKTEAQEAVKRCQADLKKAKEAAKKAPTESIQKRLRAEEIALGKLADSLDDWNDQVEILGEEIENLTSEIDAMALDIREFDTNLKQLQRDVSINTPVAESLGPIGAVIEAKEVLSSIDKAVKGLEQAQTTLDSMGGAWETATKTLAEALKSEHFESVEEARQSMLGTDEVQVLRTLLNAFGERATRISQLEGQVGDQPVPTERPDLEHLGEVKVLAKTEHDRIAGATSVLGTNLDLIKTSHAKLQRLGPDVATRVEVAQRATDFATVVSKGKGTGSSRLLGLEEWVQRILFEEVCAVATLQLNELSGSRYVLTMEDEGGQKRHHAGGLELYVLDTYNNKNRSVETLSGGEQFLTALALALALAEVVQRHAGGVQLGTLFIDEGFGSLDGDALNNAIDVLHNLQNTGRTVGVITHVEEMKSGLSVGIRVDKSRNGSRVELRPVA